MESTLQMLERRDHLNFLVPRARVRCEVNRNGQRVCRRESFFRRVGRWILIGVLLFFGLLFLMCLCCCIRRRRSKKAKKEAQTGYVAQYAAPTTYNPPHPPPPPVDSRPGQLNGVIGNAQPAAPAPLHGAAGDYYKI